MGHDECLCTGVLWFKRAMSGLERLLWEKILQGGRVFQTCGYLGNWTLWGGGVSNSNNNKRARYLEEQEKFQELHLVFAGADSLGSEFTAYTYGKQLCL